jgi:Uma2 family endonuclease
MGMPVPKMPADWEMTPAPEEADPFRYGWRPKYVRLVGGKVEEQRIPLTAEDLLDPQLGDVILTQGGPHATLATDLYDLVKRYFKRDDGVLVTFDRKLRWGIPGLPEPSPDVAVIRGVRDRGKAARRLTFDVQKEGVRPCLVVEVVSPQYEETRDNDYVAKVGIYERAGIPEYLILEPTFTWRDHILLTGYRLGPEGHYRPIEPDGQGRLLSETTGLLFGEDEDGSVLLIYAETGEHLRKPTQLEADEVAAKKPAALEAKRATREAKRATREAKARKIAEEARIAAEQRATQEGERAAREAEARKGAEAEIARLRAELDRHQ